MNPDCLPHQSDCLPHQVRGDVWDVNLPRTIEAFVTSNSGPLDPHLDFLRTYDLSPADVPLLKMGSNIDSPFEPVGSGPGEDEVEGGRRAVYHPSITYQVCNTRMYYILGCITSYSRYQHIWLKIYDFFLMYKMYMITVLIFVF